MMAIAKHAPLPAWRNSLVWSAAAAIPYILAMCASLLLMHRQGMRAIFEADVAATLGLSLIAATALVGFTRRKRAVTARNLRNFLIADTVTICIFVLAIWSFRASGGERGLDVSGAVAAFTGLILLVMALACTTITASAQTGADLLDDEAAAEELRDRARLHFCSFAWIGIYGLLLIGLSLARPGGPLPPAPALAGALALIAVLIVLAVAAWRLSDELGRTLSYETGNLTYYLIVLLGGGWALLAHLGFVAAPAPLDWLTLFTLLLFVASFIVLGRRKLLTR